MSSRGRGFTVAVVAIGAVGLLALGLAVWRSLWPADPGAVEAIPELTDPSRPFDRAVDWPEEGRHAPPEPLLEEEARALAGDRGVVCRVAPRVDGATARLQLEGEHTEPWLAVAAVHAHVLVLSEVPPSGSGTLLVEGFAPANVQWDGAGSDAGGCTADPIELEPAEAAVVGMVAGASADALGITACGHRVTPDREGGFYAAAVPGEPCTIESRRHYGVWEWVDQLQVVPERGRDTVVEIDAPSSMPCCRS